MKRICFLFLFLLLIFLSHPQLILATVLFEDNFNSGDSSKWVEIGDHINWQFTDQMLKVLIDPRYIRSQLLPKDSFWDNSWSNLIFRFDFIAKQGVDKNFHFRFKDINNWYGVHIYRNEINLEKVGGIPTPIPTPTNYPILNDVTHHVKVYIENGNYKVFIDKVKMFDFIDNDPNFASGKVGLRATTGADAPTEVWFDNVMVCTLDDPCGEVIPTSTPTPTPTPTNTPTPIIPIVILPGHGACFNHEAIIHGEENVPQEKWKLLPFVHEYDGLINSIQNSGYQLDQDLYLFCYDWRKRIDQTADVLKDFIKNKVLSGRTDINEVKLVGHSLGGLLGRSFAQKHDGANLEKLITVGSPHKGAIQVYYAWEGGEPPGEKNISWLAWQILIQIQKRGFTTNVETVRKVAPSTLDLFPTFNFLKNQNGAEKDFRQMIWKNDWLFNLNNSLPDPPFLDKTTALIGQKGNTPAWYKITTRSWLDELLGKWEDGKPTETLFENGDLTVLTKSAQIPGDSFESLNLDHGELVRKTDGIRKILELLNIPESIIEEGNKLEIVPSLIFLLGSLVNIKVTTPTGIVFDGEEERMIFIPDAKKGAYNLQITPENLGGSFELFIGQQTETEKIWSQISGQLDSSPLNYQLFFDPDNPKETLFIDKTGRIYLELAKQKILILKKDYNHFILDRILTEINRGITLTEKKKNLSASKKTEEIISFIFQFRKDNSIPQARNISFEAIKFLAKAYEILFINSGQRLEKSGIRVKIAGNENLLKSTERVLKTLEKLKRLKPANGVSFELAQTQLGKARKNFEEGNLPLAKIQLSISQSLLGESLIIF